jgi:hypothetical protein
MKVVRIVWCLIASFFIACGGAHKSRPSSAKSSKPVVRSVPAARTEKPKPAVNANGIPGHCDKKRWPCVPSPRWVQRLCEDVYPDVALHMFAPNTPWQRFYLLKNAEPVNASGGASLLGDKMLRGEEVIVLRRNGKHSGVETSDIGGYDVLRWNGACATVHDGEFALKPPQDIHFAHLEWRELGLPMRQVLEADPNLGAVYEEKRRQCHGKITGQISAGCEEYDKKFANEIVRYVRQGGKLAKPIKVP